MYVPLQEGVQPGLINAAGFVILVGGLLLTAFWLNRLYR
mgnify:FL=1|jgi:hypothetical protein